MSKQLVDGIPRRGRIDLHTPAERAIWDAVQAVEAAGCHPLLTEAVNLLAEAKERVADFVELAAVVAPPTGAEPEPHPYAPGVFLAADGGMEDGCKVCGKPFRLHDTTFSPAPSAPPAPQQETR